MASQCLDFLEQAIFDKGYHAVEGGRDDAVWGRALLVSKI